MYIIKNNKSYNYKDINQNILINVSKYNYQLIKYKQTT